MIITAFIQGQSLKLPRPKIVAGSNDYHEMQIILQTADWSGLDIWGHFTQDGKNIYDVHAVDCHVGKDQHLNLSAGEWKVYFSGMDLDGTERITTEQQTLTVQATGCICGPFPAVPLSHAEQITQEAAQARKLAEETRKIVVDNAPLTDRAETAAKNAEQSATESQTSAENAAQSERQAAAHVLEADKEADRAAEEAQRATQNILNGVDTHNQDHSAHPFLLAEVSRVESIAKGRNFAKVFPTLDAMQTFLLDPENTKNLEKGTNLYIEDLNVPDYWWDGTQAQELEVEHPDLSQYVTKTQLSMELPAVVTQEEYDRLQAAGQLVPGRIYYVKVGA